MSSPEKVNVAAYVKGRYYRGSVEESTLDDLEWNGNALRVVATLRNCIKGKGELSRDVMLFGVVDITSVEEGRRRILQLAGPIEIFRFKQKYPNANIPVIYLEES